jgi:hypothetical protein
MHATTVTVSGRNWPSNMVQCNACCAGSAPTLAAALNTGPHKSKNNHYQGAINLWATQIQGAVVAPAVVHTSDICVVGLWYKE